MEIATTLSNREEIYGEYAGTAEIAVYLKTAIRGFTQERGKDLSPDQVDALDMIATKVARILNGNANHIDGWHDISCYAALVARRLERDQV